VSDDLYDALREGIRLRLEADMDVLETEVRPGGISRRERRSVMREVVERWLARDGLRVVQATNGRKRK
jgi:hypothetical protein